MSERRLLGINLVIDDEEQSLSIEQAKELYNALGEIFGGTGTDDDLEDGCDCFWCREEERVADTWTMSYDDGRGVYTFSTGFLNVGKE